MKTIIPLFLVSALALVSSQLQAAEPARVLIVVGPSNHPPGTHEVAAGGRLMQHCLQNMSNLPGVKAEVVEGWPAKALRDAASTIVFIGDQFPPTRLPEAKRNLAELDAMMKRGCGIVCIHYATGLKAEPGEDPLLQWTGGYFASYCKHHHSVAKIFPAATISPASEHPINRGWKAFTLHDEPYISNYFGKDNNLPAPNVTVLATSLLPPEAPKRETVAWCVERPDGGRGFGIVMPHFYRNWTHEDLRRFILNGIVWSAKFDIPSDGVKTATPDLAAFKPESLTPQPWPKKAQTAAVSSANVNRVAAVTQTPGCVAFWDFVRREPDGARRFTAHVPAGATTDYPLDAANYVKDYWGAGRGATYEDFPLLGRGPFGEAIRIAKEQDPDFRPFLFVPRARLHDTPLDIKGAGKSVTVVVWAIRESGNHALAGIWHEGTDLKQKETSSIAKVERGQRQYALFAGLNKGGSACGHVSENGANSFLNKYALHKCNSLGLSPAVPADAPAEVLDTAWQCFAMTFDHEKDELTGWLNGVAGDRWLENPQKDGLLSFAANAWLQGRLHREPGLQPGEDPNFPSDQFYNPPEEKPVAVQVVSETADERVELREYGYTKVKVTLRGGRETARDLVALRLNPWWYPHDLYAPKDDGSGGPFTIGRVIHSSRSVGFTGWIGGVAVYNRALRTEELATLAALRGGNPPKQSDAGFQHFITRKDNKLYEGDKPFRFAGANMPGIMLPYDFTLYLPERMSLPTPWEQEDAFKTLDQMNLRVLRTWNLPIRGPKEAKKPWHYVFGPGEFNEEAFTCTDHMLALANKHKVRVIFALTAGSGDYLGGIGQYAEHRGRKREEFYTDPQVKEDYKATVRFVLNRVNTVTGVRYKDDKAVLAWQFGNEMHTAPAAWLSEMAAYIKSLDANHLVAETVHIPGKPMTIDPNIDLVTRHLYTSYKGVGGEWPEAMRREMAVLKSQRPMFIGEFGPYINDTNFTHDKAVEKTRAFLDYVESEPGICGSLIWSMYFRHQAGGFYWHQIMTFPAAWSYHYPGFPSADAQCEIGLMRSLREAGFKIQGLPVPPVPLPEAPHLLPINEVPLFSWRGSVGAIGYDIQRAEGSDGPWTTIAQNVSDADIAYRPLFSDTTARPGQRYSYRIIARNESGLSQPSNVVGPVKVERVCLADELQDFSRVIAKSAGLKLDNDYNALYAEYLFRAQGSTNDWVTYQVPAAIESVKVIGFFAMEIGDFELRVSSDGNTFTALKPERKARRLPSPPGGAAGGQSRTQVEYACAVPAGQRYLQVAWSGPAELDRVEIYYR